jgi:hypothetical protein
MEKGLLLPTEYDAGWATELVHMHRLDENYVTPAGKRTPAIQSAVSHYTNLAHDITVLYAIFSIMILNLQNLMYCAART